MPVDAFTVHEKKTFVLELPMCRVAGEAPQALASTSAPAAASVGRPDPLHHAISSVDMPASEVDDAVTALPTAASPRKASRFGPSTPIGRRRSVGAVALACHALTPVKPLPHRHASPWAAPTLHGRRSSAVDLTGHVRRQSVHEMPDVIGLGRMVSTTLPAVVPLAPRATQPPVAAPGASLAPAEPGPGSGPEKKLLLVVDDSDLTRKMLCRIVKAQGYDFHEAEDGQIALDKVRVGPPGNASSERRLPHIHAHQPLPTPSLPI